MSERPPDVVIRPDILYEQDTRLLGGIAMAGGQVVYTLFPSKLRQSSRVCLLSAILGIPTKEIAEQPTIDRTVVRAKIRTAFRLKGVLPPAGRHQLLAASLELGLLGLVQKGKPRDFPLETKQIAFLEKEVASERPSDFHVRVDFLTVIQDRHPEIRSLEEIILAATLSGQVGTTPIVEPRYPIGPYVVDGGTGVPTVSPPEDLPFASLVPNTWAL